MSESFEVRIDLNQEDSLSSTLFNLALEKTHKGNSNGNY